MLGPCTTQMFINVSKTYDLPLPDFDDSKTKFMVENFESWRTVEGQFDFDDYKTGIYRL